MHPAFVTLIMRNNARIREQQAEAAEDTATTPPAPTLHGSPVTIGKPGSGKTYTPNPNEPTGYTYKQWLQALQPTPRENTIGNTLTSVLYALPVLSLIAVTYVLLSSENPTKQFFTVTLVSTLTLTAYTVTCIAVLSKMETAQHNRATKLGAAHPEHVQRWEEENAANLAREKAMLCAAKTRQPHTNK